MKLELFVDGDEGVALFTAASFLWTNRAGTSSLEVRYDNIDQILVSKKSPVNVKISLSSGGGGEGGKTTMMLRFLSKEDSAFAVDAVSGKGLATPSSLLKGDHSAGGGGTQTHTSAALHHICESLVEDGIVDRDAINEASAKFRGVLHVFEAVNELVDANTLQLRPVTDQLLSDIFHQLPLLAHLFALRVRTENDKIQFVESIVKKYFCYKLTPLDILKPGEAPTGESLAPTVGITVSSTAGAITSTIGDHLKFLNQASANALLGPTVKTEASQHDFTPPDDMFYEAASSAHSVQPNGSSSRLNTRPRAHVFQRAKRERSSEAAAMPTLQNLVPVIPTQVLSIPSCVQGVGKLEYASKSRLNGEVSAQLRKFWQAPATAPCPSLAGDEAHRGCIEQAQKYAASLVRSGKRTIPPDV